MIVEVLRVIIGIIVALFLPGYLVVKLYFNEFTKLEKLAFSVTFSIIIDIAIGIFLGYNEAWANITGGLNFINIVWIESIVILLLFALIEKKYSILRKIYNSKPTIRYHYTKTKNHKSIRFIINKFSKFTHHIIKKKSIYQFVSRSIALVGIIFGLQLFIHLYFRHTDFFLQYLRIPNSFYLPFLTGLRKTDFINALLFTLIIFIIWNRNTLLNLKFYKRYYVQTIFFTILSLSAFVGHYGLKFWIKINIDYALEHSLNFTLLKYLLNILFIVFMALAVYNVKFFKDQIKKFKLQIPIFPVLVTVYFFLIQGFQTSWRFLGDFVAKSVHWLLSLHLEDTVLNIDPLRTPILGVGSFVVGISEECSGIDSLLLFISLYTVLFVMDWDRMDKKRMAMLLIPGLVGTVAYNILRIYLLILVGVFYDPKFAVDVFHSNIGWILFLAFFMVFWHFGSKWVYIKKEDKF